MYVVDASVIIAALVSDPQTAHARAMLDQVKPLADLHMPEFGRIECANVLWKRVRFHGMPAAQAEALIADLIALPLTIIPPAAFYKRALQIGLRHELAIYDSIYIALAEQLNLPLITADVRQSRAAAQESITLKPLADFSP